jgi:hypothetical protein
MRLQEAVCKQKPTTGSHPDTAPAQQALSDKQVISKNSISRTDWPLKTFGSVQSLLWME